MITNGNYIDDSSDSLDTMTKVNEQPPPSYDASVTSEVNAAGPYVPAGHADAKDVKVPPPLPPHEQQSPGAGPAPFISPSMPPTTVYNYVNPVTHEVVASLLPPDHPQMVCLQQGHIAHTRYGVLGVLAAIFWFPLGIGLCLLDRRVQCMRCGQIIDEGICH